MWRKYHVGKGGARGLPRRSYVLTRDRTRDQWLFLCRQHPIVPGPRSPLSLSLSLARVFVITSNPSRTTCVAMPDNSSCPFDLHGSMVSLWIECDLCGYLFLHRVRLDEGRMSKLIFWGATISGSREEENCWEDFPVRGFFFFFESGLSWEVDVPDVYRLISNNWL